jgi:hypothetical protein
MKPETKHRANQARELLANDAFEQVMAEIRDDAVRLFLDAKSGIEALQEAHARVRAVETVHAALQSRLDEEAVEEKRDAKKDQHRASD